MIDWDQCPLTDLGQNGGDKKRGENYNRIIIEAHRHIRDMLDQNGVDYFVTDGGRQIDAQGELRNLCDDR